MLAVLGQHVVKAENSNNGQQWSLNCVTISEPAVYWRFVLLLVVTNNNNVSINDYVTEPECTIPKTIITNSLLTLVLFLLSYAMSYVICQLSVEKSYINTCTD